MNEDDWDERELPLDLEIADEEALPTHWRHGKEGSCWQFCPMNAQKTSPLVLHSSPRQLGMEEELRPQVSEHTVLLILQPGISTH